MNCLGSLTSRKSKAFKQFHQETFPAIVQHERRPTNTYTFGAKDVLLINCCNQLLFQI